MTELENVERELICLFNDEKIGIKTSAEVVKLSNALWSKIKDNSSLLNKAITVIKDKFNERDILKGISTSYFILLDYENVNEEIYKTLGSTILSNRDIAKLNINRQSYITLLLSNSNYILSSKEKEFAVKMTDELSRGEFDIRYFILKNNSFTLEEKTNLLHEFYEEDEYDGVLDLWEWDIINNLNGVLYLDKDYLFYYNEDFFLNNIEDKELLKETLEDIKFCKLMHKLRPASWEREYVRK